MANYSNNNGMPPQFNGGYGQPPYYQPPRNNSNKTLLTVIIVLLALLLVGGGVWIYMDNKNKEEQKVQQEKLENEAKIKKLEEKTKQLEAEKEQKPKEVVRTIRETPTSTSTTPKVVINGVGVRLRFGPGTEYGYLTWSNGQTRAPSKGERLEYIDETSGWYRVRYKGQAFYVSKDFSYLTY